MLLLEKGHPLDQNIFLLSDNVSLTYQQVFDAGDGLFGDNNKELVMILCDKHVDTVIAYVAALRHNKVPLLIDRNYCGSLISSFIEHYQPCYVIGLKESVPKGYYPLLHHSYLYKKSVKTDYQLHKSLALLLPTSGSTGDPKCVRITEKNIDSCTHAICDYLEFDQHRIAISLLPIHYSYGLSVLHNCIYRRARYVISTKTVLDKALWDEINNYQVTDFSGVPFMMKVLCRMSFDSKKMQSLRYVTQAGGHLASNDSSALATKFSENNIHYYTMYGQTEASPRISYLSPKYALTKKGSVGVTINGGQAFIVETGQTIGCGELGYQGDNVAMGYAYDCHDLNLGDEFNGILHTGDIAQIDDDGFITIIGRNKRFIKISGISVNLDSIEKSLNSMDRMLAVIGKDDKLIILTQSNDIAAIKRFVSETFSINKVNVKVKTLVSIPMNASGKTDYKLLNETYC